MSVQISNKVQAWARVDIKGLSFKGEGFSEIRRRREGVFDLGLDSSLEVIQPETTYKVTGIGDTGTFNYTAWLIGENTLQVRSFGPGGLTDGVGFYVTVKVGNAESVSQDITV